MLQGNRRLYSILGDCLRDMHLGRLWSRRNSAFYFSGRRNIKNWNRRKKNVKGSATSTWTIDTLEKSRGDTNQPYKGKELDVGGESVSKGFHLGHERQRRKTWSTDGRDTDPNPKQLKPQDIGRERSGVAAMTPIQLACWFPACSIFHASGGKADILEVGVNQPRKDCWLLMFQTPPTNSSHALRIVNLRPAFSASCFYLAAEICFYHPKNTTQLGRFFFSI